MAEGSQDGLLELALESARRVLARHQQDPMWMQLFVRLAYAFEELTQAAPSGTHPAFFAQTHPEVLVRLLTAWLARADVPSESPGLHEALEALREALAVPRTSPLPEPLPPSPSAPSSQGTVGEKGSAGETAGGGGGGEPPSPRLWGLGLGTVEVAERLGMTRQAVNQRRAKGRLLAIPRGREFVYPDWQFDPESGEVPAALVQALGLLGGRSPEEKALFFLEPSPELGGERPLDVLRAGRGEAVVVAAMKAGERRSG